MILGLMILAAAGVYAIAGGWLVLAIASAAAGIASLLECIHDFIEYVLLIALAIALSLAIYDFWWHNVSRMMHGAAQAAPMFELVLLSEAALLVLLLAKMVKVFNGQ